MAGDGLAAVALIQRSAGQFGLILADLHVPGADGLAVLRAARAVSPSTLVVIITGYASPDSAITAVRLGAYDYLTKPFSLGQIDVLMARVEDRLALEAGNRTLLRRIDSRETKPHTPHTIGLERSKPASAPSRRRCAIPCRN